MATGKSEGDNLTLSHRTFFRKHPTPAFITELNQDCKCLIPPLDTPRYFSGWLT